MFHATQAQTNKSTKTTPLAKLFEMFEDVSNEMEDLTGKLDQLNCFSRDGRLETGHTYILTITAATDLPLTIADKKWRCLGDLSTSSRADLQKLAGTFDVERFRKLPFETAAIAVQYGDKQFPIFVYAPSGTIDRTLTAPITNRVISDLNSLFRYQHGRVFSYSVLLMPPEKQQLN